MVLFSLYSASIWPIQLQDWKRNLTDYVSQIYLNTVGGKHASCLHAWRGKAVKPRASRLYRGKCRLTQCECRAVRSMVRLLAKRLKRDACGCLHSNSFDKITFRQENTMALKDELIPKALKDELVPKPRQKTAQSPI